MNLSIIIPTYNCEKYLKSCLDSIFEEIDCFVEVILIDDGSTDSSANIYNSYKNKNFKIYKNVNSGVSFSRNFGIKQAAGKYIMFVDSDDTLRSGWYEKINNVIKSENFDICYFLKEISFSTEKNEIIKQTLGINSRDNFSSVWSKLYSRNLINNHNIFFNEKVINGEDLLFNLQAITKGKKLKFECYSFYEYRINFSSATHSFNEKFFDSNKEFIFQVDEILSAYKVEKDLLNEYKNFCLFNSIYLFAYKLSLLKDKSIINSYILKFREYLTLNVNLNSKFLDNTSIFKKIIVLFFSRGFYYFSVKVLKIFMNIKIKLKNYQRINKKGSIK